MRVPSPNERPFDADAVSAAGRIGYGELEGFGRDDLAEAWASLRRVASRVVSHEVPLRSARAASAALRRVCEHAVALPPTLSGTEARRFLEAHFAPVRLDAPGFVTGYYEPVVDGSLWPTGEFTAPILRRPPDLGRLGPGVADEPYHDRAAIESRVGTGGLVPVVWLRDWADVFFVHVQGSARVRLAGGETLRLVYDGRNGHAYTSIGRLLVERGAMAAQDLSLDSVKHWIRAQGQAVGEPGRDLLWANRSYIFFRADDAGPPDDGPIGGAGVPLSALRSIAVDRTLWSYGLPFFIEATLPWRGREPEPFRRLMIAQDTGSAILGQARRDLFFGSGEEAGRRAGGIRHAATFTVLLPHASAGGP